LLKEKGLTIEGAKKELKRMPTDDPKRTLIDKLQKIKGALTQIKDQL